MHLPFALLLLLITHGVPFADAFAPHRSLSQATERLHKFAKRKSAGLARDLRVVFQGLSVDTETDPNSSHRVYCVRPNDPFAALNGNNTSPANAAPAAGTSTPKGGPTSSGASKTHASSVPVPTATSAFKLVEEHSGSNFFDGWSFWDTGDPTGGVVQYLSQSDAQSGGLIDVNSAGNAVMKVDTTPVITGNRKSVRITTDNTFTQGIWVLDAVHMPQGCGTWPAFWSNGPNWPAGGEIDVVEGVNDYTVNQATIHTNPGCNLPNGATGQSLAISGTVVGGTDCDANASGNAGCGVRSSDSTTYGAGFNSAGGGVYAMLWDDDGINVWFSPRGSIPADLIANAPQPTNWGTPMARWPSSNCNQAEFFYNHSIIFDTTLCGQWAGGVWASTGVTGQEQSCAQRTGFSTCEDFVRNSGGSFSDAYWEVSSVKIYQTTRKS